MKRQAVQASPGVPVVPLAAEDLYGCHVDQENVAVLLDESPAVEGAGRRVAFVFQAFNLLPKISAFENVEMPLVFAGVPVKRRRERAAEVLERVGLGDRMDHEPTGNLDTTSGSDIMGIFLDLAAQGRTLIVITHDLALARRAHRIVEIRDGKIVRDGPAAEAA